MTRNRSWGGEERGPRGGEIEKVKGVDDGDEQG